MYLRITCGLIQTQEIPVAYVCVYYRGLSCKNCKSCESATSWWRLGLPFLVGGNSHLYLSVPDPGEGVRAYPPPLFWQSNDFLRPEFYTCQEKTMVLCPLEKKGGTIIYQLPKKCIWHTWIFKFFWGRIPRHPPPLQPPQGFVLLPLTIFSRGYAPPFQRILDPVLLLSSLLLVLIYNNIL